jgi:acetate kinase
VQIIERLLATLWADATNIIARPEEIAVVGHRIVHGGTHYHESVFITAEVQATIEQLAPFAPLHNPASLEGIAVIERVLGHVPQIAVFDTAFHRQIPLERTIYPGPYEWFEQGLRRYGFHGINHRYCTERSSKLLGRESAALRIISCHLGNGCSLAAIAGGVSVDTTMGFTPLEGLMMGSRSGSIDPGLLLYLQREQAYSVEQLDHVLNFESGFKGVSGISNDIRQVISSAEQGNRRAQIALDLFVYRLRYFIGAMLASLDGVDVLVFTGGIGEHVPMIRARACEHFRFLNLRLDPHKNVTCPVDQDISAEDSSVRILVIHANEEWEIAQTCWKTR